MEPILLKEHGFLQNYSGAFESKDHPWDKEFQYLGISQENYQASYYIGIDWLNSNQAVVVMPKYENLDYLQMFMECFQCPISSEELGRIYSIDFKRSPVILGEKPFEITPLIIVHFLCLAKRIITKGLKCDYIQKEENLKSKIKGKILISSNIKTNISPGRHDRFFCRYQDYSMDCQENRILKKTLLFVSAYLSSHRKLHDSVSPLLHICLSAFESVSPEIDIRTIKQIHINPFFKEYVEAVRIAKIILRQMGYSLNRAYSMKDNAFPPFYINMPLLFECYVYKKLSEVFNDIEFQSEGQRNTTVDFLKIGTHDNQKLIIDAKYRKKYGNKTSAYEIDDIRQLSGYARDKKLLNKLNVSDDTIVDCLIIYFDENCLPTRFSNKSPILEQCELISDFARFYKYAINLPKKRNS